MLAEYWMQASPASHWQEAMPGVRVGFFDGTAPMDMAVSQEPGHYDAFFCQGGRLELTGQGNHWVVENRDILLMTDFADVISARVTAPLEGVLIHVESRLAGPSLEFLGQMLGDWDLCMDHVREYMLRSGGCSRIHGTPWNQSVFAALESMERDRVGKYCVLKTAEMLYLLDSSPVFKTAGSPGGYVSRTIEDVRKYMEGHLDEKLTITNLSRQFHISPTALKSGFRQLYGTPIHRWLQTQRMNYAAGLLRESRLTVLQVAQNVGYEGLSQFNITFKQQFGMTPVQYKKMSNSVNI